MSTRPGRTWRALLVAGLACAACAAAESPAAGGGAQPPLVAAGSGDGARDGAATSTDDGPRAEDAARGGSDEPAVGDDASGDAAERPALPWPAEAPPLGKALYVGTWSVDAPEDFDESRFDEAGLQEVFSRHAVGRRTWAGLSAQGDALPLDALLRDRPGPAMAYTYALVQRWPLPDLPPDEAWPGLDAVLHLRHRGRLRAWFDGELVFDEQPTPDGAWRHSIRFAEIEAVIQLHRLREVLALIGFTRFEAVTPDINGEFETDVERAEIAIEPQWFPAVENRGEGIFVQLRDSAVKEWLGRSSVAQRIDGLVTGHGLWMADRKAKRSFPGGPYVLLHTLSHLLIQSIAMRCGYPASSIRERIYADAPAGRFGILLYTGSPDAEGTLGGLVQAARHLENHLLLALRMAGLCSNDPICAQHAPGSSMEKRWLHGAACHGCALVAETSCEMRNDYLDRALVVPVVGASDSAFFAAAP